MSVYISPPCAFLLFLRDVRGADWGGLGTASGTAKPGISWLLRGVESCRQGQFDENSECFELETRGKMLWGFSGIVGREGVTD